MAGISKNFLYPKLRGRIVEKFCNYDQFAKWLGVDPSVVSRKLNGDLGMTKADIIKWAEGLEIPLSDYGIYFFENEVNQT